MVRIGDGKMKKRFRRFVFFAVLLLAVGCAGAVKTTASSEEAHPRNIILLIGDGMGIAQVTALDIRQEKMNLERMSHGGFAKTYPAGNGAYTDSASSGTALATGHKTNNGMVGVSPEGKALENCVEAARRWGKSTGVVATSRVTHATPAAFLSHVKSRNEEAEIARQISESIVDVIFGGGLDYFVPKSSEMSARKDEADLADTMASKGYFVVRTYEGFKQIDPKTTARVAGFFYPGPMPEAGRRKPSLREMTEAAIEILSKNEKGFFLMVEGSQIDWKCHSNELEGMIEEVRDFDEAVGVSLDFAQDEGRTLVIATADHECGGFVIRDGDLGAGKVEGTFASKGHTCTMVPVLSLGPGAGEFSGIIDNTLIGEKIIDFVRQRE